MANLRAREAGQAVLEFTEIVTRFPRHPLAASAQLAIGEAYQQQGDVRQALIEYRRVTETYAGSPQVPEALLRIGLCQRTLGDARAAVATWERLAREHPKSAAAARARALLDSRRSAGRAAR
jgi:tol-pal system protein YbgF